MSEISVANTSKFTIDMINLHMMNILCFSYHGIINDDIMVGCNARHEQCTTAEQSEYRFHSVLHFLLHSTHREEEMDYLITAPEHGHMCPRHPTACTRLSVKTLL